ncbi:DUF1924 domain-containing protein [Hydrogenophaga sp. OTU3427]|uniref:DUF1924 domain-containing protein n=1 Tax=Hydrogenophaga sp. OTU3427 TaxID=3043856 RepID=UPI00313C8A1D
MTHHLHPLQAAVLAGLLLATGGVRAADTSAPQQLERWSAQASAPGNAERGQQLFTQRHGAEWSCSSCHHSPPTRAGQHASTGKPIAPLAPAFNREAFTDSAKVDKWFRRNCKDVLSRECSPGEKANVLAYLLRLKP